MLPAGTSTLPTREGSQTTPSIRSLSFVGTARTAVAMAISLQCGHTFRVAVAMLSPRKTRGPDSQLPTNLRELRSLIALYDAKCVWHNVTRGRASTPKLAEDASNAVKGRGPHPAEKSGPHPAEADRLKLPVEADRLKLRTSHVLCVLSVVKPRTTMLETACGQMDTACLESRHIIAHQ